MPRIQNPFARLRIRNPLEGISFPGIGSITDLSDELRDLTAGLLGLAYAPKATAVIVAYFQYLENQAKGKLRGIPRSLRNRIRNEYDVDLDAVKYAQKIDTVHGKAITVENHIYFPTDVDFSKRDDLWWVLHELEHCVQYAKAGGKLGFLAKYAIQHAEKVIETGSLDICKLNRKTRMEKDADGKADRLTPIVYGQP